MNSTRLGYTICTVAITVLLTSIQARAEIFVCENDGRKTFSQQPCGSNSRSLDVDTRVRKITLPELLDDSAAEDICSVLAGAWDMLDAAGRNQSQESYSGPDVGPPQARNYLRERISNYRERVAAEPALHNIFEAGIDYLFDRFEPGSAVNAENKGIFIEQCPQHLLYHIRQLPHPRSKPAKRPVHQQ